MLIHEPALVLNSAWQPITFLPIGTCISTLMRDMACVVHPTTYEPLSFEEWMERAPDDSRFIKTSGRPVPAPDVIVLKKYGKRPPMRIKFNRTNLFRRDEFHCQYCGTELPGSRLQVEHVIPKSRGGPTTWENTVAACNDCNSRKGNKTPEEAGMRLKRQPAKPRWKRVIRPPAAHYNKNWLPFLKQGAGV